MLCLGRVRAVTLIVVIQMRQVDEKRGQDNEFAMHRRADAIGSANTASRRARWIPHNVTFPLTYGMRLTNAVRAHGLRNSGINRNLNQRRRRRGREKRAQKQPLR